MNQADANQADMNHAVEIAERVWWVGHYLPGDVFQCHVYLIENGDQSVLVDPGSALTFAHTLKKIGEVISFSRIRYFICHHQDPDITGAMGLIDQMISRDDALLVTHWRAAALLKHYDLKRLPFWQVEDHDWKLELEDRTLRFIFTPYMHFPGAFCSFDEKTQVLFSSDIFGGFTEQWSLFARDESYFESLKPFHEHYMPGRDILQHGLSRMQQYPIRMIAPQHGSIIPEELVDFMFGRLKGLECGLYLMVEQDTDVKRLMAMNRMLQQTLEAVMLYRDFGDIAHRLLEAARQILPVSSLEFVVWDSQQLLRFGPADHYHGVIIEAPPDLREIFSFNKSGWQEKHGSHYREVEDENHHGARLLLPLFPAHDDACRAVTIMHLEEKTDISEEMDALLGRMSEPLLAAVEREMIYREMEEERNAIYEQSIRDPLTGLFTRHYMRDVAIRMLEQHDRDEHSPVALVMLDIDHFKHINDSYGHMTGDKVLRKVGALLLSQGRRMDVPVRFGGEEFAVFIPSAGPEQAYAFAERLREKVAALRFKAGGKGFTVTISAGIAAHQQGESLEALMNRADAALYRAKEGGRNRVCMATGTTLSAK
ncbi:MAG: diguanylate cyclase [Mariprofundaceae bacterium]|nr:diguanylate cyclase [Mariprofundaceae bacterium]